MNLFLFTNFFPFKRSEPFLVNEFDFTKKTFDHITLFALYGHPEDKSVAQNKQLTVLTPPLTSASDKKKLFTRGLFNAAPFDLHVREFFSKALFLSPKKLYGFF